MKYSVIIPIYNAEDTLRRCLDSLLPQLCSEIEVLLINDGSNDKSESICKEYMAKTASIKYYSQKNSGVSVARNKGLEAATGDYILFVDSDDYVTENYFKTIRYYASCNNPDLLMFGAEFINRKGISIVYDKRTYSGADMALEFLSLYKQKKVYTLCNKAFSKHIIDENGIRFDSDLHIGEDAVFVFHFYLYANSLTTCGDVLYNVDESNQGSLSRKQRENLCAELIATTNFMEKYLEESSKDDNEVSIYKRCLTWGHYRGAYSCFNEILSKCDDTDKINDKLVKVCNLFRKSSVKPIGFGSTIISLPVLTKALPLIKLLFLFKNRYR